MKKSNFSVYGAFCFWLGCAAAFAALALRCVQVFKYTDYETAHVLKSASESVAAFYSLLAASAVFFALSVIKYKPFSSVNRMRGKSIFALCLLSGAGMFYDFVYRCILCFDYVSSTQHPAANRLTPMICTAIFALFSAAFFIALGISFKTTRYQMSSLWFLYISPVMWAISGLLSLLTVYDDVFFAEETFLKYAAMIAAVVFFLLFALGEDKDKSALPALVAAGLVYGSFAISLSVPRIAALAAGLPLVGADFSSVSFLFTGLFAVCAALKTVLTSNEA